VPPAAENFVNVSDAFYLERFAVMPLFRILQRLCVELRLRHHMADKSLPNK
jgi:hypothetical protein